jgi:hypothetical protein
VIGSACTMALSKTGLSGARTASLILTADCSIIRSQRTSLATWEDAPDVA